MTTDSVFILFKKTDFNTILACLGGKVYRWWGVKIFVAEIGGSQFYRRRLFVNLGPPSEENASPLTCMRKVHIPSKYSQVFPEYPWLQLHVKYVLKDVQLPPFAHGLLRHGLFTEKRKEIKFKMLNGKLKKYQGVKVCKMAGHIQTKFHSINIFILRIRSNMHKLLI